MISEALIVMSNMRGGYANVGATVHTLFRMNRRSVEGPRADSSQRTIDANAVTDAVAQSNYIELAR
jgi:hypothetical protein